jgi:hypothetical protein
LVAPLIRATIARENAHLKRLLTDTMLDNVVSKGLPGKN